EAARLGNVVSTAGEVVRVKAHRGQLAALARIESVARILEHLPVILMGEETNLAIQTGRWTGRASPYIDAGIDGSGHAIAGTSAQLLMMLDDGVQLDTPELSDTPSSAGAAGPLHRKVRFYGAVAGGDLLGCDASGGLT